MSPPLFDCLRPLGLARLAASWALALLASAGAWAQDAATLTQITQSWIDSSLHSGAAAQLPLRMEVEVGELDPRLRLAPFKRCTRSWSER